MGQYVQIAVGYTWGSNPSSDRYAVVGAFLRSVAAQARGLAMRSLHQPIIDENPAPHTVDEGASSWAVIVPGVDISRLRASAGQFTWPAITQRMDNADIIVFDLTPVPRDDDRSSPASRRNVVSSNVWLEIGYALGTGKQIFLIHAEPKGYKELPSDLLGLIVGCVPNDPKHAPDTSLRMGLVHAIKRSIQSRMDTRGYAKGQQQSIYTGAPAPADPSTD